MFSCFVARMISAPKIRRHLGPDLAESVDTKDAQPNCPRCFPPEQAMRPKKIDAYSDVIIEVGERIYDAGTKAELRDITDVSAPVRCRSGTTAGPETFLRLLLCHEVMVMHRNNPIINPTTRLGLNRYKHVEPPTTL